MPVALIAGVEAHHVVDCSEIVVRDALRFDGVHGSAGAVCGIDVVGVGVGVLVHVPPPNDSPFLASVYPSMYPAS